MVVPEIYAGDCQATEIYTGDHQKFVTYTKYKWLL